MVLRECLCSEVGHYASNLLANSCGGKVNVCVHLREQEDETKRKRGVARGGCTGGPCTVLTTSLQVKLRQPQHGLPERLGEQGTSLQDAS